MKGLSLELGKLSKGPLINKNFSNYNFSKNVNIIEIVVVVLIYGLPYIRLYSIKLKFQLKLRLYLST